MSLDPLPLYRVGLWNTTVPKAAPNDAAAPATAMYPSTDGGEGGKPDPSGAPYPTIAFAPGYQASRTQYLGFLAPVVAEGFVVLGVDYDPSQGPNTVDMSARVAHSLDFLEAQNSSSGSSLHGMVHGGRLISSGHSMGGGLTILAASKHSRFDAALPLSPYILAPLFVNEKPADVVKTLAMPFSTIVGSADGTAVPSQNSNVLYSSGNCPKAEYEITGGDHVFSDPAHRALAQKYIILWLKYHVLGDASVYDALYGSGAQADQSAGKITYRFCAGAPAPAVTGTVPPDAASNVSVATNIEVSFSVAMSKSETEGAFSVAPAAPGAMTWSAGDTKVTLDPTSDLAKGTRYTVTVSTGAKSAAGQNLPAAKSFFFTTVSDPGPGPTPPKVTGNSPQDRATGVPLNADIVVNFDMAMSKSDTEGAFSMVPAAAGAFAWSGGDATLTYNPSSDLAPGTQYAVALSTAAKSAAGASLGAAHSFKFTTGSSPDTTPPVIRHTAQSSVEEGTPISVIANVTDDVSVAVVTLHYRPAGGSFVQRAMTRGGSAFSATVPAADVKPDRLEYYIEAVDGSGNRASSPPGAPGTLHVITVTSKSGPPAPSGPLSGVLLPIVFAVAVAFVVAVAAILAARSKKKRTPPSPTQYWEGPVDPYRFP